MALLWKTFLARYNPSEYNLLLYEQKNADGEGFEPSLPIKVNTLSKRARSTTLPPILSA